ncbi:MAG: short-chain dehydrogenase [Rhodospirillaceae bacterium]|nr:short-chain dehydrogenase [Rhodospirillaceae bacterium]|tara:strand:- start:10961 stop:11722 length:762 start_codon:yes stop_codon:yes gene_type:complete
MVDLVNELEGKVAIVSGSARNIGRATAVELAKAGASLVVNARESKDLCDEVVAEIEGAGGKAIAYLADITDADAVRSMVDAAVEAFGGIDILVNNAAVRSNIPFLEIDQAEWARIAATCLQGTLNLSRTCIPYMIERGGGAIVSLAGLSSYKGSAGRSHVMATKDGLMGLTRGLAIEFGEKNIRANAAVVGRFDTVRSANAPQSGYTTEPDIPLGRMGVSQDMADVIRFLVGPGSSYISGQTIHVNGAAYCPH